MHSTQMTEKMDGTVHPARAHDTLDLAVKCARRRSGEKQCSIAVRDEYGTTLHNFEDGEDTMAAPALAEAVQ